MSNCNNFIHILFDMLIVIKYGLKKNKCHVAVLYMVLAHVCKNNNLILMNFIVSKKNNDD